MAQPAAVLSIIVKTNARPATRELTQVDSKLRASASSASSAGRAFSNMASSTRKATGGFKEVSRSAKEVDRDLEGVEEKSASSGRGMAIVGAGGKVAATGVGKFAKALTPANSGLLNFTTRLPLLQWGVMIAGAAGAATAVVALAAELGPLTGLLGTIPGLAVGAGQAVGALGLAFSGVGAALKAATKEQVKGGVDSAAALERQRSAAEGVRSAEQGLADAQRGVGVAQRTLTQARKDATRELEDMQMAASRAHLDERGAILNLKRAKVELRKAEIDRQGPIDLADARLRVMVARADLHDTRVAANRARKDYADANKKGVEGSDQVVSAHQQLADAQRSVSEASHQVAVAQRSAAAAMAKGSSAANNYQQAMAKLPPSARAFVHTLLQMKPALDQTREVAAKNLFPGLTIGIKSAMKNLPVFQGMIGRMAKAIGGIGAQAGKELGSANWGRDLAAIGKTNAGVMKQQGKAGINFANALRHIAVAAQPLLKRISGLILGWSRIAVASARAGRQNGKLTDFFDRTWKALTRVISIGKNFTMALLRIGHIEASLGRDSGGLLGWLDRIVKKFRNWTESTKGTNAIKHFFIQAANAGKEVAKIIKRVSDRVRDLHNKEGKSWGHAIVTAFAEEIGHALPHVLASIASNAGSTMFHAFTQADVWGKIIIAALVLRKLIPFLSGIGRSGGAQFARGFFGKAESDMNTRGGKLRNALSNMMGRTGAQAGTTGGKAMSNSAIHSTGQGFNAGASRLSSSMGTTMRRASTVAGGAGGRAMGNAATHNTGASFNAGAGRLSNSMSGTARRAGVIAGGSGGRTLGNAAIHSSGTTFNAGAGRVSKSWSGTTSRAGRAAGSKAGTTMGNSAVHTTGTGFSAGQGRLTKSVSKSGSSVGKSAGTVMGTRMGDSSVHSTGTFWGKEAKTAKQGKGAGRLGGAASALGSALGWAMGGAMALAMLPQIVEGLKQADKMIQEELGIKVKDTSKTGHPGQGQAIPPGTYDDKGKHRAGGGPVRAGQTYMVGEKGPETFVPRTSGQIMPNKNKGGGGWTAKGGQAAGLAATLAKDRANASQPLNGIRTDLMQMVAAGKLAGTQTAKGLTTNVRKGWVTTATDTKKGTGQVKTQTRQMGTDSAKEVATMRARQGIQFKQMHVNNVRETRAMGNAVGGETRKMQSGVTRVTQTMDRAVAARFRSMGAASRREAASQGTRVGISFKAMSSGVQRVTTKMAANTGAQFKRQTSSISSHMKSAGTVTADGAHRIYDYMAKTLEAMGAGKPKQLKLTKGKKKQRGGVMSGGKPTGDSIPATLERGEYVVNRKAVKAVGVGALNKLNYGIPRKGFQDGGGVGSDGRWHMAGGGVTPTLQRLLDQLSSKGFHPSSLTTGNHAPHSLHYSGRAADFGDATNDQRKLWGYLYPNRAIYPELFGPRYLKKPTLMNFGRGFSDAGLQAQHDDHIHVGVGGKAGKLGPGGSLEAAVARLLVKPGDTEPANMAQYALDKIRKGAQSKLDEASAAASADFGSVKVGGGARAKQVYGYMRKRGFSPAQSAGWAGVFHKESNFSTTVGNKAGSGATGLAQWLGGRLAGLKKKKNWTSMQTQLDYVWEELQGSEHSAYGPIKRTSQPEQAARVIDSQYERSDNILDAAQAARSYYNQFHGGQTGGLVQQAGIGMAEGGLIHEPVGFQLKHMADIFGIKPTKKTKTKLSNRRKKAVTDTVQRINSMGLPGSITGGIGRFGDMSAAFQEYADRAQAITGEGAQAKVSGKDEAGWLKERLKAMAAMRNYIIDAIRGIEYRQNVINELILWSQQQIAGLRHRVTGGEKKLKDLRKQRDRARGGKRKRLNAQIADWADLTARRRSLADNLSGQIIPALNTQRNDVFPEQRSGLLESLSSVQGIGPMSKAGTLPVLPTGTYGGDIFTTQMRLKELGEKGSVSAADSETSTQIADLERGLKEDWQKRFLVSQAQYKVLRNLPQMPFGGSFATGGIVPGPNGAARQAVVHSGEGVFTADQMAAMGGGGDIQVVVNGDIVGTPSGKNAVEVLVNGVLRSTKFKRALAEARVGGRSVRG